MKRLEVVDAAVTSHLSHSPVYSPPTFSSREPEDYDTNDWIDEEIAHKMKK